MRILRLILVALLLCNIAIAQNPTTVVRFGSSDPATCAPAGANIFLNTTSNTLKVCTAANTWSILGGSTTGSNVQFNSVGIGGAPSGSAGDLTMSGLLTVSNGAQISHAGTNVVLFHNTAGIRVNSTLPVCWASGDPFVTACDTSLTRLAAGQLGVTTSMFAATTGKLGFASRSIIKSNADGTVNFRNNADAADATLAFAAATQSAKTTTYNNVATAGQGIPSIYAAGRVTAQSAANANIAQFTVGAADGSFEVSMNMNVTAVTTLSTTLSCTYTDESNTSRTMIFPVQQLAGNFIAGGLVTAVGAWETPVMHIRCKAATTITLFTATGTFTGVTYTAEGIIKQTA